MNDDKIVRGEVIPPEARSVQMPAGTPLGLGILGAMKFAAISRVIDQYERALRSKELAIEAEEAVARALVRREVARVSLQQLDTIRDEESNRITELAAVAKLRRKLERLELEDRVAEAEEKQTKRKPSQESESKAEDHRPPDEFTSFMDDLRKMPDIVKAVAAAKDQIIRDAGGEDKLSESQRQACDLFDAMLQAFMSKKAGDAAL